MGKITDVANLGNMVQIWLDDLVDDILFDHRMFYSMIDDLNIKNVRELIGREVKYEGGSIYFVE